MRVPLNLRKQYIKDTVYSTEIEQLREAGTSYSGMVLRAVWNLHFN